MQQGMVLSPFHFTLYTLDFRYNTCTTNCQLHKVSNNTAIVGCVSKGSDLDYRRIINVFIIRCKPTHLDFNTSKMKEM